MLQSIRDKSQSWVMWVIVCLIILMFGLWGVSYYLTGPAPAKRAVASIDGSKITAMELQASYNMLKNQQKLAAPDSAQQQKLRHSALEQLIHQQLLYNQAHKLGLQASKRNIASLIHNIPAFQGHGDFDPSRLQMYLQTLGTDLTTFEQTVRQQYVASQLMQGLSVSQFALPGEVSNFVSIVQQNRQFDVAIIKAKQMQQQVAVTDKEIHDYYSQHKLDFQTPEQIKLSYLELGLPQAKSQVAVTDSKLHSFYQDHQQLFRQGYRRKGQKLIIKPLRSKSKSALEDLGHQAAKAWQQGASQEHIAKILTDAHVKVTTEEIPWTSWTLNPQAATKALFNLNKIGAISSPIIDDGNVVLVRLQAKKEGSQQSFNAAKSQVKQQFIHSQAEAKLHNMANQLANLTFEYPNSLQQASDQLAIKLHKTDYFTKAGDKHTGILQYKKVRQAALSKQVLKQGNNSDLIQLAPNHVVVVRVADVKPSKQQPLDQVKPQIKQHLLEQKAKQAASKQAQQYASQLRHGDTINAKLDWQSYNGREDQIDLPKALLRKAFFAMRPAPEHNKIMVADTANGDSAIIRLNKVTLADHNANSDHSALYHKALEQFFAQLDGQGLLHAAQRQANITTMLKS